MAKVKAKPKAKPKAKKKPSSASITAKKRKSIPKAKFALPKGSGPDTSKDQYPVDTPGRAANAKARATQQFKKGTITKSQKDKVMAKANAKLKGSGSSTSASKKKRKKK